MKSFAAYISKNLLSFAILIIALVMINTVIFGLTFHQAITEDYGKTSPHSMLEATAESATKSGLSAEMQETLRLNNIWAFYLNLNGECLWEMDLPNEIPTKYSIQDIASFSKGYIADYPVFVWSMDDGLLVLGYPKDSYIKQTSNYYSIRAIKMLPAYIVGILAMDLLCLFFAYYLSKRKIIRSTAPIISGIENLSDGKPVHLSTYGELSGIADSVNKASMIINRQSEARANWISGVSHDIRTPLSIIMGYAEKIVASKNSNEETKKQANVIRNQSVKIKELVQDLNLVSKLEYEMQPLQKENVRPARLLRSYAAELLNMGIADIYLINIDIAPSVENMTIMCDPRLITRAINNLVQNSMRHNPEGCDIKIFLFSSADYLSLVVEDNGVGISAQKMSELKDKPHYMESMDDRFDLRHGMGLLIVQQITSAHKGSMLIESSQPHGCKVTLTFPTEAK